MVLVQIRFVSTIYMLVFMWIENRRRLHAYAQNVCRGRMMGLNFFYPYIILSLYSDDHLAIHSPW